jgi:hypothetical protein
MIKKLNILDFYLIHEKKASLGSGKAPKFQLFRKNSNFSHFFGPVSLSIPHYKYCKTGAKINSTKNISKIFHIF